MSAPARPPISAPITSIGDDDPPAPADDPGATRLVPRWLVAAGVVFGIVARLVCLIPLGRPDSDEVIAGLMARGLLAGDGWPPFYWGQAYGGTPQIGPLALSTAIFGPTTLGLRLPNVVLGVLGAVLVWRVARRVVPARVAPVAGLLAWVGFPAAQWYGSREMLFYQPTVVLGLAGSLAVLRTLDRDRTAARRTWPDWAAAGLCFGLGWWASPNIVYFVAPTLAVLVVRRRRLTRQDLAVGLPTAAVAAVIGASVWLAYNLSHSWASLHANDGFEAYGIYPVRVGWFVAVAVPGLTGWIENFTFRPLFGPVGVIGALATLYLLARATKAGIEDRGWDAFGVVAYPLIFGLIPFGPNQANSRYLFFFVPFVAIVLSRLVTTRRAAVVLVVAAALVSTAGLARVYVVTTGDPAAAIGVVDDLGSVVDALDRRGITEVYADYWVAYRLVWDARERIVATPVAGLSRHEPYRRRVDASERTAWLTDAPNQERALRDALAEAGIGADIEHHGVVTVFVPERPFRPADLPGFAGQVSHKLPERSDEP